MTSASNSVPAVDAVLLAYEARYLLDFLEEFSGNGDTLRGLLRLAGMRVSQRRFDALVDRLERDGLVRSSIVECASHRVRAVELTGEGRDVQQGNEKREWIATGERRPLTPEDM